MRFSHCDRGSNLDILVLDVVIVQPRCEMSPRIHCNDFLGVIPCRKRSDIRSGLSVGEIRLVISVHLLTRDCKCVIDTVRASVSPNRITSPNGRRIAWDYYWTTFGCIAWAPFHRRRIYTCLTRIRGEDDLWSDRAGSSGWRWGCLLGRSAVGILNQCVIRTNAVSLRKSLGGKLRTAGA